MALSGPITIISIDYRLSPTHLYPIPINDGWDAFQYIVTNFSSLTNVSNLGNDRVRLVVSGTSAGGQLAAIVSQRARTWLNAPENATVAAMVTFSGVLLRAPVTVRATETDFIPPRFRDLHRSWSVEFESRIKRSTMEEDHGLLTSLSVSFSFLVLIFSFLSFWRFVLGAILTTVPRFIWCPSR
jgi:acetyl esterase/lipase